MAQELDHYCITFYITRQELNHESFQNICNQCLGMGKGCPDESVQEEFVFWMMFYNKTCFKLFVLASAVHILNVGKDLQLRLQIHILNLP